MILVTCATGRIGRSVVRELVRRGIAVRALVRDAERGAALLGAGVDVMIAGTLTPEALEPALEGVEAAMLIAPQSMDQYRWEAAFIDAAQRVRLPRLVKLSAIAADANSPSPIAYWHGMAERRIAAHGIPCTMLRPNLRMQTLLAFAAAVRDSGALRIPVGPARAAVVDDADIAGAAATLLVDPSPAEPSYILTGSTALGFDEIARDLSAASGQDIAYRPITPAEFKPHVLKWGVPALYADALVSLWRAVGCGRYEAVTDDVERLTGRPPAGFRAFAATHAALFRRDSAVSATIVPFPAARRRTAETRRVAGSALA